MAVEVGDVDARLERPLHLRAQLDRHLLGLGARDGLEGGARQVALVVEQRGDRRASRHGPPAVVAPLRVEGEVHAEIELGALPPAGRSLREPGTRHHDAAAGGGAVLEGLEAALVGGVAHPEIVDVHDRHAIPCLESQPPREVRHRLGPPPGRW